MNSIVKLIMVGIIIGLGAAPLKVFSESDECPCESIWQAALDETPCTSDMYLFNGMLRRDEVASQGTIIWWSFPYPEPTSPEVCLKARTFKSACDLILGIPEETRCNETEVLARFYFSENSYFGKCKGSMYRLLLDFDSLPNCD
jgi:hypothetical protein